jgi:23S rRNA (adenine1618-N6)-methyltransferase
MHSRSKHRGRYDFNKLIMSSPALKPFVAVNRYGDESIDFSDSEAVKALNRAIIIHFYGLRSWEIPEGYLCPPIPGRADSIHSVADLLATSNGGEIPRGKSVRVLDIGVGANCIYPLIGQAEYGWSFVGSDSDPIALEAARKNVEANGLNDLIELRLQSSSSQIFKGILQKGETFDAVICNPPFHSSRQEADLGTRRKWNNLGKAQTSAEQTRLNFGGQNSELWCPGGEVAFIEKMVRESVTFPLACRWYSTLVSKGANLPKIYEALEWTDAREVHTLEMAQGQKCSRLVAWTFQDLPYTK